MIDEIKKPHYLTIFSDKLKPNKGKLLKLNITMSKVQEKMLEVFFKNFQNLRESPRDSEYVNESQAAKRTGLSRYIIKKLAEDNLIRKNSKGEYYYPDAQAMFDFLNYFQAAKNIEVLKETDITGVKKYLMLDFQQNKLGKSLSEYQLEVLIKMTMDFSRFIPELQDRIGLVIPKKMTKQEALAAVEKAYQD